MDVWEIHRRLQWQHCAARRTADLGFRAHALAGHVGLGLVRTPRAFLRASLRASPGRCLGVVRPSNAPTQKGVSKASRRERLHGGLHDSAGGG